MKLLIRYLILFICLFISAIYFNMFQLPNKIVTGGLGGISIIINYYFNIEPSKIILIISLIILILGFFLLGKIKTTGAIIATFIYPTFIDITANINDYVKINIHNLLVVSILIGILSGLSTGIVYKIGFSNGGLSIVSELISKYLKISIGLSSFIVNIIIVLLGSISIGLNILIYATIILMIHGFIINIVLDKG